MRKVKRSSLLLMLMLAVVLVLGACSSSGDAEAEQPAAAEAPAEAAAPAEASASAEVAESETETEKRTIRFADTQFQTLWLNNAIAGFVVEHGYGYPVETIEVTTPVYQQSLASGELDVMMELWRMNIIDWYNEVTESGQVIDLGETFERSTQGFYVPRYVIEGDPERGIEPTAPELKSVFDLPEYTELFQDPEDPSKGRLISCITGWQCAMINRIKMNAYGLMEDYNLMEPGASAALDASIAGAYTKGEPILAYYWEPTWLLGTYDMVQLEEPEWTPECDAETQRALTGEIDAEDVSEVAGCGYQTLGVRKGVHGGLAEEAPELVEFFEAMFVGTDALNRTSAYMSAEEVSADEAALWYFANYQEDWREWLSDDVEAKVEAALIEAGVEL